VTAIDGDLMCHVCPAICPFHNLNLTLHDQLLQTFQGVNKGQQDITCFYAGRLVSDSDHTSSALNPTKAMVSLFFAVDAPHRSCHSHGLLVVGRVCGVALAWA